MNTDNLYIVIPAYNESENISSVINAWYDCVNYCTGGGYSLLIIDDGSTDNTFSIIKACAEKRPGIIPITKPNSGHGSSLLFGYRYAIEHGADYIFQTDSDGQTNPEEFASFWALRHEYDAVLGKRTKRGDGASRKFVEGVLCMILRVIFGVKVPDANAPFRLMKAPLLKKYLARIPENYNIPNAILTAYFAYFNENITFREITFKPRQAGTNSINVKKICRIGFQAVKDFLRFRRDIKNA